MRRLLAPSLVASALCAALLAGCSASVDIGGKSISSNELATQVTAALAGKLKVDVDKMQTISCPDNLDATVGATTTCVYHDMAARKDYDIAVKVTSVNGSKAQFSIAVAPTPRPASTK